MSDNHIYRTKNGHIEWGKLFIKNKHENKQLQIKSASLQGFVNVSVVITERNPKTNHRYEIT